MAAEVFFNALFFPKVNPVAPIYVGQLQNGVIWICVEGKGSFKNSSELKEFASIVINKGAKEFVIDLKNCPVMDSTFMGTLVGITRNLSTIDQSRIDVINANSRNEPVSYTHLTLPTKA